MRNPIRSWRIAPVGCGTSSCNHSLREGNFGTGQAWFDFIDIGGSTGALGGSLCASITDWSRQMGLDPRFRIALVDICRTATSPILSEPELTRRIEAVTHLALDYRTWLAGGNSTQAPTSAWRSLRTHLQGLRHGQPICCSVLQSW